LDSRSISHPELPEETQHNFSYYPILLNSEKEMLKVQNRLNEEYNYPRRYFYPNLTRLPYVTYKETPVAQDIASRVLCLPLSPYLEDKTIQKISSLINEVVNH